ncbi:xylulokinase [Nocardioides scoriae]|uniref:Xylulokinase n=1 Tax=Nocardioides scoriae TaxID=642780 RepID=A0A1H1PFX5_9ACTN|nr:FGGY family carbohydrate kinase [Nocardioides scoriae]SDS10044.1 xylulokinase [Nocardioides scoriae]
MTPPDQPGTLLGIDLGTASVKVVLTDTEGRPLVQAQRAYDVDHPRTGWSETAPQHWWEAVGQAVREVAAHRPGRPLALGLSGQMHGVVLTADDHEPVRPAVLWSDSRAAPETAAYDTLPATVRARLANPVVPGMAGPQLSWVARHEPDLMSRARWALQPKDWLRLRLTGIVATEPSDASGTLLWDVVGERWDPDVVSALSLDLGLLPPVLRSGGAFAGALTTTAAEHLGLPPGIPVAAGGADTAVALLGTRLSEPGSVQLTIGTGVQLVTPLAELPTPLPRRPLTHTYRTVDEHGWYAMAASINGGSTLAWVCQVLGMSWPELYATAALPAHDDDPLFLPHLHGERTAPTSQPLLGAWTGLSPRHDRARLARAALEGVAIAVHEAARSLSLPASAEPVRLAGGGTVAPAWRQLLADALGRPLDAVDTPGASGLGAALLAGRAIGVEVLPPSPAPRPHAAEPRREDTERLAERAARWRRQALALQRSGVESPAPPVS